MAIRRFKGVLYIKESDKWRAFIKVNKKQMYLGTFFLDYIAARAYDKAVKKYKGDGHPTNKSLGLFDKWENTSE